MLVRRPIYPARPEPKTTLDNHHPKPHTKSMDRTYRKVALSDRSHSKLADLTLQFKYSNHYDISRVLRIRGLHMLIAHTFDANPPEDWFDDRDPRIQSLDHPNPLAVTDPNSTDEPIMKRVWFLPGDEPQRYKARMIKMTDGTIRKILEVAAYWSVESPLYQVRNSNDVMPKVAVMLELWGAGYLIPKEIPYNPNKFAHPLWSDRSTGDVVYF